MKILKDHRVWMMGTLGIALILRMAAVGFLNIAPGGDALSYMTMAKTMLESGNIDDSMGNVAYYSSGYPLFLIPFFAVFQSTAEIAQMVNLALGVGTVFLVYLCGAAILPSRGWAIFPALIWATYPPALLYTEYVLKENLLVPLLLLQTYLLVRYTDARRKDLMALTIGLVFGFELLVGAAVLFTGVIVALVIVGYFGRGWSLSVIRWRSFIACCFGCALVLTPWLSYTTVKLGKPTLATNGGFNLYLGNNPNATGYFVGIEDTPMAAKWSSVRKEKGEIEAMALLKGMAIQHMLENPGKTIELSLKKLVYFWWPPVHQGKYGNQSTQETLMRLAWRFYYVLIMIFALVPLAHLRTEGRGAVLLIYLTVILYCAVHAATYVIYRYRLPAMPMMALLATVGLHYAYLRWNIMRSRFLSRRA